MNKKMEKDANKGSTAQENVIIQIRNLDVVFPIRQGNVKALDDISLDIYRGETLGLVGESGCGKSTLGFAILNSVQSPGRITRGTILFNDEDITGKPKKELRRIRGKKISMIFQDPMTSLNPLMRIDRHIIETIRKHERNVSTKEARERAAQLLDKLGIIRQRLFDYPHQLSGGMRQRVMIGIGLTLNAEVLIADEPTTSLDVIVEAQFIDQLNDLQREFGLTLLLITHNMGIVAEISDRIAVMYCGQIVEISDATSLFHRPLHPYTEGLLHSIPNIKLQEEKLEFMPGFPPDLLNPPEGCRFSPRCKYVFDRCEREYVPLYDVKGRSVRCFKYVDDIGKN
jgi:oligopeptide/dipeptide ABC transporter ATP-binding protein